MKSHSFDIEDAEKYGVNKAILLQHLKFHMDNNRDIKCFHSDGVVWCYARLKSLENTYPYFTSSSISRWLKELEEDGVIVSTRDLKNEVPNVGHHTKFYHVVDFFSQNGSTNSQNGSSSSQNGNSLLISNYNKYNPPIVPPSKKDEIVESIYNLYPRKVGKKRALKAIENAIDRLLGEQSDAWDGDDGPPWVSAARWVYQKTKIYANSPQAKESKREYIPHPATWFNADRFYDEKAEWEVVHTDNSARRQQQETEVANAGAYSNDVTGV